MNIFVWYLMLTFIRGTVTMFANNYSSFYNQGSKLRKNYKFHVRNKTTLSHFLQDKIILEWICKW